MDLLIIILAVALAVVGFMGGTWFWQEIAESPIWKQVQIYVKIVGLCGATVSLAILIFLFWRMKTQPMEYFRQLISYINVGSWFLSFYMLGYDASIFHPEPEENKVLHGNEKSAVEFHIKWDLLRKELFASIAAIAPAAGLLLIHGIDIQLFRMWVASVVGFAMGFFFWEHLKESGILKGTFKYQLILLSLLTTIAIGSIAGYGIYVDLSVANPESIQTLLMSIMLFTECMAWYMVGLCVVAFRK